MSNRNLFLCPVIETGCLKQAERSRNIPPPPTTTLRLVTEREPLSETLWFEKIKMLNKIRDNSPDPGYNLRQERLD
jgi:hypothetical protein